MGTWRRPISVDRGVRSALVWNLTDGTWVGCLWIRDVLGVAGIHGSQSLLGGVGPGIAVVDVSSVDSLLPWQTPLRGVGDQ